jgi:hypothetical protein
MSLGISLFHVRLYWKVDSAILFPEQSWLEYVCFSYFDLNVGHKNRI